MEIEKKDKANLLLLTFSLVNLLLVVGYIYTWIKGYHLLPEDWKWGEMQGNHGYWRRWGFREVYGYFLFLPVLTGLASLIFIKKETIKAGLSCLFSAILFAVAVGHFWLID